MKTILIIEDNLEIRENTAELLELEGYNIILSANGNEGYATALEKQPDVILCDIMMPGANGYEVFNLLKGNEITAAIPFIFLTASAEKKDMQAGLDMGAHGYIRKPFEIEELLMAIDKCLV